MWKISYSYEDENYRWRPKTRSDTWCPQSEEKLCELCPDYATAPLDTIFWVDQKIMPPLGSSDHDALAILRLADDDEDAYMAQCITKILTEPQFEELVRTFPQ